MEKSERRGVMRATAMSMFLSRARAAASSMERSTRGPVVRNGADACGPLTGAVGVCPAGGVCGCAVGVVCAAAGHDRRQHERSRRHYVLLHDCLQQTMGMKT